MKLIYAYSEGLPSTDTQSIQALRTCHGLASSGCRVDLLIGKGCIPYSFMKNQKPPSTPFFKGESKVPPFRKGMSEGIFEISNDSITNRECTLGKSSGGRPAEILTFYGLRENPHLTIHRLPIIRKNGSKFLPFSWHGLFHMLCLAAIIYLNRDKSYQAIYIRHPKLAAFLTALKKVHKLPIIYEAHELFHLNEDLLNISPHSSTAGTTKDENNPPSSPLNLRGDEGGLPKEEGGGGSPLSQRGVRGDFKGYFRIKRVNRLKAMEARIFRNADAIVSITENLQKVFVKAFGPSTPVWVIPDGTDIPAPECFAESRLHPNTICYVGQLYPWKGVDTLIRAMSLIDNASLEIIGGESGDITRLRVLAKEQGVVEKVRFNGMIKPAEVFQHLCQAGVAVLPATSRLISSRFTSPLKLFEYMACRIPIVAANVPSYREVLVHGKNALLVKPEDHVDLAAGIKLLLENRALAEKISRQAFMDVQEFTWEKRGRRIIEVVQSLKRR